MNCGTYAPPIYAHGGAETPQPRMERAKVVKPDMEHFELNVTMIQQALEVMRTLPPFMMGKHADLARKVGNVEDGQRMLREKIAHVERQCRNQELNMRAEKESEKQGRDSDFARLHRCIRDLQEQHELLAEAFQAKAPTIDSVLSEVSALRKQLEEARNGMATADGHIADGMPKKGKSQFDLLMGEINSLRDLYTNYVDVRPSKTGKPAKIIPKKEKTKPKVVGRRKQNITPMTMVTRSAAKRATRSVALASARRSECN